MKRVDERIKNIKIYVDGRSAEIQKNLFELGAEWYTSGKEVVYTADPFLYLDEDGRIQSGSRMITFTTNERREVKADEVLGWEPEMEEPTFEPFQKVLVRDTEDKEWRIGFYSHRRKVSTPYIHRCLHANYSQCIPYEGNEHLLGTTDEPSN